MEGDEAVATDGTRVATKTVQAVDRRQSNETPRVEVNEQLLTKRREALEKLAKTIQELLPAGERKALTVLGRQLNQADPDWRDEYLKPLRLGRTGGPGGQLRTVLELFPELFTISGEGSQANMFAELT